MGEVIPWLVVQSKINGKRKTRIHPRFIESLDASKEPTPATADDLNKMLREGTGKGIFERIAFYPKKFLLE